jgi:hypothetical protein
VQSLVARRPLTGALHARWCGRQSLYHASRYLGKVIAHCRPWMKRVGQLKLAPKGLYLFDDRQDRSNDLVWMCQRELSHDKNRLNVRRSISLGFFPLTFSSTVPTAEKRVKMGLNHPMMLPFSAADAKYPTAFSASEITAACASESGRS